MLSTRTSIYSSLTCLAALVFVGCSPADNQANSSCDNGTPCPNGQRCDVANKKCVAIEDTSNPQGDTSSKDDASTTDTSNPTDTLSNDAQDTFVAETDTFRPECTDDNACSVATKPFCVDNKCQACSGPMADTQCRTKFPTTPYCVSSVCVECTASTQCATKNASKPVCDTNACRPAQRNLDCPDSALELDATGKPTGKCLETGKIVYVDDHDLTPMINCTSRDGTKEKPACTIQQALIFYKAAATKEVILVKPSKGTNYKDGSLIKLDKMFDKTVRIVGARTLATGNSPAVIADPITMDATGLTQDINVSLEDLYFAGVDTMDPLVSCKGSMTAGAKKIGLTVRDSRFENGKTFGLQIEQCDATVEANWFTKNKNGLSSTDNTIQVLRNEFFQNTNQGLYFNKVNLTLLNNVVAQNGDSLGTNAGGVQIKSAPSLVIAFNTIVDNKGSQDGYNLECPGTNDIYYNILEGSMTTGKLPVDKCKVNLSIVPTGSTGGGLSNVTDFIPAFKASMTGDYHLNLTGADIPKVRKSWTEAKGNLSTVKIEWLQVDVDGDRRDPRTDGTTDIGADQIPGQ